MIPSQQSVYSFLKKLKSRFTKAKLKSRTFVMPLTVSAVFGAFEGGSSKTDGNHHKRNVFCTMPATLSFLCTILILKPIVKLQKSRDMLALSRRNELHYLVFL